MQWDRKAFPHKTEAENILDREINSKFFYFFLKKNFLIGQIFKVKNYTFLLKSLHPNKRATKICLQFSLKDRGIFEPL